MNGDASGARFCDMRVLLQARETGLFYKEDGTWTDDRDQAKEFSSSREAANKCRSEKLQADLFFAFGDPLYDLKLPCA